MNYTREQIERAKDAIRRAVMIAYGGDLLGPALVGVDVDDDDAVRYLDGATIDQLLGAGR